MSAGAIMGVSVGVRMGTGTSVGASMGVGASAKCNV